MTTPQPIVAALDTLTEFDFEGEDPMATAVLEAPQTNVVTLPRTTPVVPLKVGWIGEQGTGKTTSAALLSAALSKECHGGAPVWVTDPELSWQFPKKRIFQPEKIELVQRTVPTFAAMLKDFREAERAGACVYNVELQKIWIELLKTVRSRCGQNWGSELSKMWGDWANMFMNSRMHCNALGRIGDVTEEILNEQGEVQRIKTGEKMKAGGSSNFGYEPHLLIRMSLEIKPRRKLGQTIEGEGRMVHLGHVFKDRTWELNGKTLRWSDKSEYKPGSYAQVWASLRPHFREIQLTEGVLLDTAATSDALINNNGNSEYYEKKQRKEVLAAELHATMDSLWGGAAVAAKQMRMKVFEHIFGFKSKEAADAASLDTVERGVRILQAFEHRAKTDPKLLGTDDLNILATLDIDIREFDEGKAEELELPF